MTAQYLRTHAKRAALLADILGLGLGIDVADVAHVQEHVGLDRVLDLVGQL